MDYYNENFIQVNKNTNLLQSIEIMKDNGISHLIIVNEKGVLTGVISEKDIITKLSSKRILSLNPSSLHISSMVARKPEILTDFIDYKTAIEILLNKNIGCLPVVIDDKVKAIITKHDLVMAGKNIEASVEEYMTHNVLKLDASERLVHVTRIMMEKTYSSIPVVSSGRIIGIITDTSLMDTWLNFYKLVRSLDRDYRVRNVLLRDIISRDIYTISPKDKISDAVSIFLKEKAKSILIQEEGELVGILTKSDVLRAILEKS